MPRGSRKRKLVSTWVEKSHGTQVQRSRSTLSLLQANRTHQEELLGVHQSQEKRWAKMGPEIMRGKRQDSKSRTTKCDAVGLATSHIHVLSVSEPTSHWIVDSGVTCHICNSHARAVWGVSPTAGTTTSRVGDGRKLEAVGIGVLFIEAETTWRRIDNF